MENPPFLDHVPFGNQAFFPRSAETGGFFTVGFSIRIEPRKKDGLLLSKWHLFGGGAYPANKPKYHMLVVG